MEKKRFDPLEDFLIVDRGSERIFVHTEQMEETFYAESGGKITVLSSRNVLDEAGAAGRGPCEYPASSGAGTMFVTDDSAPSAGDLRALMKKHGLTGSKVAEIVGVNSRTVRKWTGGERGIPNAAWRLLLIAVKE